jgi:uncharacterized protein YdhG (YjbR/CyaY superfamily)
MQVKRQKARAKSQNGGGKTVAAYLAALPKDSRAALQKLRKDIRAAAPGATELIAWDMPAFKLGRLLVGYAAFKDHCSFFPMSLAVMRDFAAELKGYSMSKGTIRFSAAEPLPTSLVRRIVKARIAENQARQALHGRR